MNGYWSVETASANLTSEMIDRWRDDLLAAAAEGKTVLVMDGITLIWHPAPDSLDAAWKEAEAALPEGWDGPSIGPFVDNLRHVDRWTATAVKYLGTREGPIGIKANAPTPAAALRALAAKLRERQ